jgi:Eco57I restriction-modification methylase
MRADIQQIKRALKSGKIEELFKEDLGWNRLTEAPPEIPYDQIYKFKPLAQKIGFKVYQHVFAGRIPENRFLYQLSKKLDTYAFEHLTIFFDASGENQAWVWVKTERENNMHSKVRIFRFNRQQSGDLLAQKLESLFVAPDEEELVTLTTIRARVKQAFDVEKITKTFYIQFKEKHADFLKQIENIPDDDEHREDREWYASIMLNRLMFVYFIQRKGLLNNHSGVRFDGDKKYLQNRLRMTQENPGPDGFYAFYRYFLHRLFHEGLSKPEPDHTPELERIIGKVPYINGGLFDVHVLEQRYPEIKIKDKAFEQIFEFFENFDWHLDDRSMRKGNEINPDVLGYIFEKYINQKQMGAYYTKEDITEYISKNTIIPFIFEKVASLYPDVFGANGSIWSPLQEQPDEYIYDAMAHGTLEPLPPEIEVGRTDVTQRASWNQSADELWALPTETWREVVERRQRHEEIRAKMVSGEISTINDLITYNLDITQFAIDAIIACEEPGLLRAFYDTIEQVTVLDPTCGSGAFLFAALNILKPLYQICIERMPVLVAQAKAQKKDSNHIQAFKQTLERVDSHKSQDYFILKSIIVKNLYGVDIMEEAIEICKLRLFLKLVAQIDSPRQLEPLPDIDFNILAGNTLIGFTSLDEVRRVVTTKLVNMSDTERTLQLIEQQAKKIEYDEQSFRKMQTEERVKIDFTVKQQLRMQLRDLRAELDPYLATEYGIDHDNILNEKMYEKKYTQWHKDHKPFHWWIEFYTILEHGGFDVVVGNPPYVEYSKVRKTYTIKGYRTENCGNLYAAVIERSFELSIPAISHIGLIVPLSICGGERFEQLRTTVSANTSILWLSNFEIFPSKLFDGAFQRLSILLAKHGKSSSPITHVTKIQRWYAQERQYLINLIRYAETQRIVKPSVFPKLTAQIQESILKKVLISAKGMNLARFLTTRSTNAFVYYQEATNYWMKAACIIPFYKKNGIITEPSHGRFLYFDKIPVARITMALMNSSLFYVWFASYSDGFHLSHALVKDFPVRKDLYETTSLIELSSKLEIDIKIHAKRSTRNTKPVTTSGATISGDLIEIEEYRMVYSKNIIDEIDRVLAQHYGFTPEELDFIINYDIKYRMGRDSGEESEE